MKKIVIVGLLVLTMAMAVPAMAFEKGTIRLGAGTGLVEGTGFSQTTLDPDTGGDIDFDVLSLDMGYFLTDIVELAFQYASESVNNSDTNILGIAGKYYFPMGENSVFVGGGFQNLDLDGADGDVIYATGGYNFMLRDYFSIDFYLALGKGDIDGDDFNLTDIGVTYSIYFK